MKTFIALAIAGTALSAQAAIITQWNFEAANLNASTGAGTASYVGGTTLSGFNSGNPLGTSTTGWNITTWPAQGTNNKTAGAQFAVSTASYQDIKVTWAHRHSNTAANTVVLQYTTNGTTWTDAQTYTFTPAASGTGDTWYQRSFDFSSVAGVSNNSLFAVRMVTAFAPGTGGYLASRSTSNYATTGTNRFDDVTFEGTLIPSSGSLALMGMGLAVAARRRRA